MEDMPPSGPDNTKLEVSASVAVLPPTDSLFRLLYFVCAIFLRLVLSLCRLWSMTSTLSWWKTPVWACVSRYIALWNRAISSWTKRTKRAWRSSVRAVTSTSFCSVFFFRGGVSALPYFNALLFQKLWISQEWTYSAKCTISGKTKSASVRTAKDWLQLLASPHTWRNAWAWDATAAASPTAGRSVEVIQERLLSWSKMGVNI